MTAFSPPLKSSRHPQTMTIDLVRRAQDGETDAFGRLVDRYSDRVRHVVRRKLGPKLRRMLDSADIVQEASVQAMRKAKDFRWRDEAGMINWLCKLAQNAINAQADYFKADKRNPDRLVPIDVPGEDEPRPIPDTRPGPGTVLAGDEQVNRLASCLRQLPAHYQEIIRLRDYERLSWREVAERAGRPSEAAARMMHTEALYRLQKLIRGFSRSA